MASVESVLIPEDQELWKQYLKEKALGLKKQSNKTLNMLISHLKNYPSEKLDLLVLEWCRLRDVEHLQIQHPLFAEIICPNLLQNISRGLPDYYRLLATFQQSIYSDAAISQEIAGKLGLKNNYFDSVEILEKELLIGPNKKAATLLINQLARQLDFAFHELPHAVLLEAELIQGLLSQMKQLLHEYDLLSEIWRDRINYMEYALDFWLEYQQTNQMIDFEEFLAHHPSLKAQLVLDKLGIVLYDLD